MLSFEYEPALVEAAVLAAVRGSAEARAFHDERDPLYDIADAEARQTTFIALHARWFLRLGLDRPLQVSLDERPEVAAGCARGIVARAPSPREQGADLLVAPPAHPTLLTRLTPETLAAPELALALARRELLHVRDVLERMHADLGGVQARDQECQKRRHEDSHRRSRQEERPGVRPRACPSP